MIFLFFIFFFEGRYVDEFTLELFIVFPQFRLDIINQVFDLFHDLFSFIQEVLLSLFNLFFTLVVSFLVLFFDCGESLVGFDVLSLFGLDGFHISQLDIDIFFELDFD